MLSTPNDNIVSPLTGSKNVTLLREISAEYLIQGWQKEFQIDITTELKEHSNIYLYQCNETQLKFFTPFDIAGSGHLYEQLQKFDWYYMIDKWEHKLALKDLSTCKKVLEIGSAFGDFVNSGIRQGLDIVGIELNKQAVARARQRNLPVKDLDLKEAAKIYQGSLDGVCSFQVLEHVANPREFIECSIQMLKPGGRLILCVPNIDGFQKYKDFFLDMPPHHMHQWSAFTFKSLENLFPIKLKKIAKEPLAKYHTSIFIDAYSHQFSYPIRKIFFNHYLTPLYKKILDSGLHQGITGMSLYVLYQKTEEQ